jgi:hypothetical protein
VRLVLAIISFCLAALLIGFGIAQRTVFAGPDHVTAAVETTSNATVTVIDGATLNSFERSQTIRISGADTIFAAYGRTGDVLAWVGDSTSYNAITLDPETNELVSTLVSGASTEVPDPAGSDLWFADYTETKSLGFTVNVPEDISVIIVSDGIEPAPSSVSVTWQLDNSTPFAGPLVVGGAILLLLGLGFLLWAVNHIRRSRGPRRKQPKLPKVPKKPTYKPVKRADQPAAITRGRRSAGMIAVPTMLVGALLLSGCTDPLATIDDATMLETSATAAPETEFEAPAVTEAQAKRIISRIAATVAEADAANDSDLIATRMDGPALVRRAANYTVRKVVTDAEVPVPIPTSSVEITLPQQNDSWPRTVLAVVQSDDLTVAPQTLVLIQDDPRSQYKVHYSIALEPGTVFPKVPPASIGTSRVSPDSAIFTTPPADLAAAYGDILTLDTESEYYDLFETEGDSLRIGVGKQAQDTKKASTESTAELSFSNSPGAGQIVVMVTNDGGAIVALELNDTETIKPVEVGAAVNAPPDVAALLGKSVSTKGLTAIYGDQLLFYVPSAQVGGKIVLLGYTQGLVSAVELS